ncbi:MAG: hypothetical protein M1828_006195 [Chrysothrix sp. TS-e1954]|nr:MAG: hypothetical protein M1828_006195 [Chrysothrix sp. TS-e1954]
MPSLSWKTWAAIALATSHAGAVPASSLDERATSPYAPVKAACPGGSLVRPATGISAGESSYVSARKPIADAALAAFLAKTDNDFGVPDEYPTIAFTSSGGGLRALLETAGVHQTFDERDSTSSVAGVYQALTYESGLSGGSWFLGSLSGNNWPTISSLKSSIWEKSFHNGLFEPDGILVAAADLDIVTDLVAKDVAGFSPTITDPYARLLGYLLLEQRFGGVSDTLSGLTSQSQFASNAVPFPIITALGNDLSTGQCEPPAYAIQYEFTPYEFGSWDSGVAAFTQTKYLGSSLSNGKPTKAGSCETRYDNLGFVMGTSSNVFNEICANTTAIPTTFGTIGADLTKILDKVHSVTTKDEYATYPNPFHNSPGSPAVSSMKDLTLVDGGESNQNNPLWPFLHRAVDVIIVSDNSADTSDNYPDGSELHNMYIQASAAELTTMPFVPSDSVFVDQGLNKRPTFFGCNDSAADTIIYLPNTNYTFDSGQSTARLEYNKGDTDAMIANGNLIGSYGDSGGWATCLACGIMGKSGAGLPGACTACFERFCYN